MARELARELVPVVELAATRRREGGWSLLATSTRRPCPFRVYGGPHENEGLPFISGEEGALRRALNAPLGFKEDSSLGTWRAWYHKPRAEMPDFPSCVWDVEGFNHLIESVRHVRKVTRR